MNLQLILSILLITIFCYIEAKPNKVGIIGGHNVTIEDNPWHVAVSQNGFYKCGGALVAPDIIMTAASCIIPIQLPFYTVQLGTNNLFFEKAITVGIRDILGSGYHIMLLKLSEKVPLSEKIQPVPLSKRTPDVGSDVNVTGWGVLVDGSVYHPVILNGITVKILDHQQCVESWKQHDYEVTNTILCAGLQGKGACLEDEGGPLTKKGTLVGLLIKEACERKDQPSLYTDISSIRDWIHEKIGI